MVTLNVDLIFGASLGPLPSTNENINYVSLAKGSTVPRTHDARLEEERHEPYNQTRSTQRKLIHKGETNNNYATKLNHNNNANSKLCTNDSTN